jgi:hypothetical protein
MYGANYLKYKELQELDAILTQPRDSGLLKLKPNKLIDFLFIFYIVSTSL